MLRWLGIETRLQLAITLCVLSLMLVTTLGGSGGAPWVFLTSRTLLIVIAILSAIGCRRADRRICPVFLSLAGLLFSLMLVSVLSIHGSHFEGFYLWYKYAFWACAFLSFANYARYQSSRWKGAVLAAIVALNLGYLLPDLITKQGQVSGFSQNNANYFGTFLLIGLAASAAGAAFGTRPGWRVAAAASAAFLIVGIVKTSSRGATLAMVSMLIVVAIRTRERIPRQVWLAVGLTILLTALASSPFLIRKFVDRGEVDPYNYARPEIWLSSLRVIEHSPILGVGFGQFQHVSKRFTFPVDGTVSRYLKRAQMAHNEYLQHFAELGIPAAVLLFALIGYMIYLVSRRAATVFPEYRCFHEAALLTAAGVGTHALVDNCWTIPVTVSALIVLALANPLPLRKTDAHHVWGFPQLAFSSALAGILYIVAIVMPGLGLYYDDLGHKAYDRDNFAAAERYHLAALRAAPNNPSFLDNLGMVYLQEFVETRDPKRLEDARTYFERAIAASPLSLDPHIHLESVLLRSLSGDPAHDRRIYEEIVPVDKELLQIDPYIPIPRKNLATAYYKLGQPEHAFEQLAIAIDYEPNFVPGYLQIASWYGEHGDMAANQRYVAIALGIVNKYRNYKPANIYESVLLGRPEASLTQPAAQNR